MGSLRGGIIIPELRLYATIRWLAGGSHSDLQLTMGVSKASFYRVVWQTIKAINACEALATRFPSTDSECLEIAQGFENVSTGGVIDGCVGAIDGWLLKIDTPPKKDVGNVKIYFNGHYQRIGINCQAVADSNSRFTYFGVLGAGVTHDNQAYKQELPNGPSLKNRIDSLPEGYYVIGDAAYVSTNRLVSIFGGIEARRPKNDAFNLCQSMPYSC